MGCKFCVAAILAFASACAESAERKLDPKEDGSVACSNLRDHMIGLRLAGATHDLEQHRSAMKAALGPAFVDECAANYTSLELECALAAADQQTLQRCLSQ